MGYVTFLDCICRITLNLVHSYLFIHLINTVLEYLLAFYKEAMLWKLHVSILRRKCEVIITHLGPDIVKVNQWGLQ
jgi:hypothetical protein